MATKLAKSTYPVGHSPDDFQCFGPVVTRDTEWGDARLCDLGCFKQDEGVDSNKMYHLAVVKSTVDGKWYAYYEWGRTKPDGRPNKPAFQFFACISEDDAKATCEKQFHAKNTKRGQWEQVGSKERYVPRVKKDGKTEDLYVVRPLATRLVGLPNAQNIANQDAQGANGNGAKAAAPKKKTTKKSVRKIDTQTHKLFSDLLGGAKSYAQTFLGSKGGPITLPTQDALDEGREILTDATKRVGTLEAQLKPTATHDQQVAIQVADKTLMNMTKLLHGLIPRDIRGAQPAQYILSTDNILKWQQDIDVLETALQSADMDTEEPEVDVMQGIPAEVHYIPPSDALYKWLVGEMKGKAYTGWWPTATRYRSGTGANPLKVHGLWAVERTGDRRIMRAAQEKTQGEMPNKWNNERPLFQDKKRPDLNDPERKLFWDTNTALLFHGTRSVNVPGIVRENLRFPTELTGVIISGAMFGPGSYFADDWSKSAGYCSNPNSGRYSYYGGGGEVKGRRAFMFAFDVICGVPELAPGAHGYKGPPKGCHCVFGKHGHTKSWGGTLANNEWILYHKGRIEMRYLAEVSW